MINFEKKISKQPLKFYLLTLITIVLILGICLIITLFFTYQPIIESVSSFFNQTNVSTTVNFFYQQDNANILDFISPIIAILGAFGVLSFLFYSIKEGTYSKSDKKIIYEFEGGMGFVIILTAILLVSAIQSKLSFNKYLEFLCIFLFLVITVIVAIFFIVVNEEFEENYPNRIALINFLEISDDHDVIWQPVDNFSRYVIKIKEYFSTTIFLLILLVPIFGFLVNLNVITIVVSEILVLALFSGYCRLTKLCEPTSEALLNQQFYSQELSFTSKNLSKIFILSSPEKEYFKILTNHGNITILKNEIITIHDNELIIFKGKEKLAPLNIWIKRTFRLVVSAVFSYFFYFLLFFYSLFIVLYIHPNLQQMTMDEISLFLFITQLFSIGVMFSVVGIYHEKIDGWLEKQIDQIIVPSPIDEY